MKPILLFIKRLFLFAVFFVGFYLVGLIIYGHTVPRKFQENIFYEKFAYGFSNTRFKEVKNTSNVDILFLGSSRSYRHYDPRIFKRAGYSSFNLGSSAQTFLQTEILVNRYLTNLNPKYVVLDIYPGMFLDGIESSFDLISNDYNSFETLNLALKLKNIKVLNTWIYATYQEYLHNALKDVEDNVQGSDVYISGGFVQRDFKTSNRTSVIRHQKWLYNERQWNSFKSIVEKIKNHNATLLVIHSPRHSTYKYSGEDKLLDFLNSNNLKFYNYKTLEFIEDSLHFYDPSHLNQEGVSLYNKFLISQYFK
jgi:hypothetical protein